MKDETNPVAQDGNSATRDPRPPRRGLIAGALGALAAAFAARASAAPAAKAGRPDEPGDSALFPRFKNFKLGTKNVAPATTALEMTGGGNVPALTAAAAASAAGLGNANANTERFGSYNGEMPLNLAAVAGESSPGQIGVYGNSVEGAGVWGGSDKGIGSWAVTNTGIGMLARAVNPPDPTQEGVALAIQGRLQHDMIASGDIREGDDKAFIPCIRVNERSLVLVTLNSDVGTMVSWVELLPGQGAVAHFNAPAKRPGKFAWWVAEAPPAEW